MVKNGQNGLKWSKMVPNGPKWWKMVKMVKIVNNGQNRQKWSKWSKMAKNGPTKCSKMMKNGQNGQNCQKWSKLQKMPPARNRDPEGPSTSIHYIIQGNWLYVLFKGFLSILRCWIFNCSYLWGTYDSWIGSFSSIVSMYVNSWILLSDHNLIFLQTYQF